MYTCVSDLMDLLKSSAAYQSTNASQAIRSMQLSQHDWYPEYDCTQEGGCPTEVDPQGTTRVALFSGLFSHALYREASALELYLTVSPAAVLIAFTMQPFIMQS